MIETNTTKRFKYIWFVLFYITFIFVAIIYSYQVFSDFEIDQASWQDVASYDACFCKVLALDLAMALCQRIKQSESAYDSLRRQREDALGDALRCNALEYPARPKPTGNWLRARIVDEWGAE